MVYQRYQETQMYHVVCTKVLLRERCENIMRVKVDVG